LDAIYFFFFLLKVPYSVLVIKEALITNSVSKQQCLITKEVHGKNINLVCLSRLIYILDKEVDKTNLVCLLSRLIIYTLDKDVDRKTIVRYFVHGKNINLVCLSRLIYILDK